MILETKKQRFRVFSGLIFFILFTSCKNVEIREYVKSIDHVTVTTIHINSSCMNEQKDLVKYPNINFTGETFRKAFIRTFNNLSSNIQCFALEKLPENAGKTIDFIRFIEKEHLYIPGNIPLRDQKNVIKNEKTPGNQQERELIQTTLKEAGSDAWMIMNLKTSVWAQDISGSVRVYTPDGKLIWQQEVYALSTYIITDEKSPYFTEYDRMFDDLANEANHQSEIRIIFKEFGEKIARQMADSLQNFLHENP